MTEDQIIEACDPDIRHTVAFLRQLGLNTTDSGDGVTKFKGIVPYSEAWYDLQSEALTFPHVFATATTPESAANTARHLFVRFEKLGIGFNGRDREVEVTYSVSNHVTTIFIRGINDDLLKPHLTRQILCLSCHARLGGEQKCCTHGTTDNVTCTQCGKPKPQDVSSFVCTGRMAIPWP